MVTSMLEKAIEIEGLLRIIRDGKPLPETYTLLHKKVTDLAEQTVRLEEPEAAPMTSAETPLADFIMAPPETTPESGQEVTFSTAANAKEESDLAEEDLSLTEEDDIILTFDDSGDFSITQAPSEQSSIDDQAAIDQAEEGRETSYEEKPEETQTSANTTDFITDTLDMTAAENTLHEPASVPFEVSDAPEVYETTAKVEDKALPAESPDERETTETTKSQIKLRASFSLNDRYLYARELFNGNMKMLDSTLDFLEGIEDYSIIEDYFYSELEWNPEDTNVAAFMEILRPHFKE